VPIFILFGIILIAVMRGEMPERSKNGVKLPFKEFFSYYNLSPSEYEIHEVYFPYRRAYGGNGIVINFGFIDYYRYTAWVKRKEQKKHAQKTSEQTVRLIKLVQEDIDKIRAQAQAERDSAERVAREVLERLKGSDRKAGMVYISELRPGMRVKIVDRWMTTDGKGRQNFMGEMDIYLGNTATVMEVCSRYISIREDGGRRHWFPEMLDYIVDEDSGKNIRTIGENNGKYIRAITGYEGEDCR